MRSGGAQMMDFKWLSRNSLALTDLELGTPSAGLPPAYHHERKAKLGEVRRDRLVVQGGRLVVACAFCATLSWFFTSRHDAVAVNSARHEAARARIEAALQTAIA